MASVEKIHTRVAPSQTDSAIQSGGSIRLFSFTLAGIGGNGTVTVEQYGTSTVLFNWSVISGDTIAGHFEEGLLCRNGIQVTTNGNADLTLVHSRGGIL